MNVLIETVIVKVLAPYLEGVSRENLRVGLLSGKLRLSNLSVKPSLLTELKLHRCSFESAKVGSLSISVPWKNLSSGKISIDLSSVSARVIISPGSNLSKEQLLAMKRDVIDSIKAKLQVPPAPAQGAGWDSSFMAKLIRRLLRSILIHLDSIDVTFVLLATSNAIQDEEGFVDASEERETEVHSDDSEVNVKIGSVELADTDDSCDDNIRKQLEVRGIALAIFPSGTGLNTDDCDFTVLPRSDLTIFLSHDATSGDLVATVTGLDACEFKISRSQLVLLKDAFMDVPDNVSVRPVEMNEEAKVNYGVLYKAQESRLQEELNDLTLLFDATAIARCEHALDRQHNEVQKVVKPTVEETSWQWTRIFFAASKTDVAIEEFVQAEVVEVPRTVKVTLDVGKDWRISLVDEKTGKEEVFEIFLFGAKIEFESSFKLDTQTIDASLVVTSDGFKVSHKGKVVLDFRRSVEDWGGRKLGHPLQVATNYSKNPLSSPPTQLDLIVSVLPLSFVYEPGLLAAVLAYFSFLTDRALIDSVAEQKERIVKSGLEMMEAVKNSPEYRQLALELTPTVIGVSLDIAGPLISLPTTRDSPHEKLFVSFGHMNLEQPKCVLNGSETTLVAKAVLEQVSVSAGTRRILSPALVDVTLQFVKESNQIEFSLALREKLECRVCPKTVKWVKSVLSLLLEEVHQVAPMDEKTAVSSSSISSSFSNLSLTESGPPTVVVSLKIEKIDIMVNDGSADSLNLQLALPAVSFALDPSNGDISINAGKILVVARLMNLKLGDWEPLLEPACLSLDCAVSSESGVSLAVSSQALNLVASPTSLKNLFRLGSALLVSEDTASSGERFRIVNSSRETVYVKIASTTLRVDPSDSHMSLDNLVLASGAREVLLVLRDESHSLMVPLERFFSASLASLLVHTIIPEDGQYRCIIVSENTFLINQCDEILEISLPARALVAPEARLLGAVPFRACRRKESETSFCVVNPGRFVSLSVMQVEKLQVRRWGSKKWMNLFSNSVFSKETSGISDSQDFHLRIEAKCKSGKPPFSSPIYQVHVRPPLTISNNLPLALRVLNGTSKYLLVKPWEAVAVYSMRFRSEIKEFGVSVSLDSVFSDSTTVLDSNEERFLISLERRVCAAIHLTTVGTHDREITVFSKWWMVDRTGMDVEMFASEDKEKVFKKSDCQVWLLPDPDTPVSVSLGIGRERWQLTLPDSGHCGGFIGKIPFVVISRETYQYKYLELVPKYTFFNGLEYDSIFIEKHGGEKIFAKTGAPLRIDKTYFRFRTAQVWSCRIPLKESSAGIWPVSVGDTVLRVEIAPVEGCVHVSVFAGSTIKVRNEKQSKEEQVVFFTDKKGKGIIIAPCSEIEVGWTDPFSRAMVDTRMKVGVTEFVVPLARAGDHVHHGGCVKVQAGNEPQSIVVVVESRRKKNESVSQKKFQIQLDIEKIGFSLVNEGKELCYAELALVRAMFRQEHVTSRLALLVSEIQIESCFAKRPVVLANAGEGLKAFFEAVIETASNVSVGVAAVPFVNVQFDALYVEVDSDFMAEMDACLTDFIGNCDERVSCLGEERMRDLIGKKLGPLVQGNIRPVSVSTILILDQLQVSALSLELWADMSLQSLRFMPVSLKLIVGMLSLGKYFKLEGAKVHVKRRHVSAFKGSSAHFIESFMYDYSFEAVKNMASLLGSSSLLRIPRAPIKLVTGVGASATKVVGSLGHLAADLASDSQYRESQAKIRKSKKIKGFADGLVEGATRLGEGAEGLFDILTAPVQGARSGGVSGFFKGIGKGLVGTIVKPITKVGEAVADVGTGIAKTFAAPSGECRDSFARKRIPRAFFGRETDTVLDYKELDAMLFSCLKKEVLGGMELVLPCCNQTAVVCFPEKLLIVEFFYNCDKIEIRREIFFAQIHAVTLHEGLGVSLVDIFGISLDLELDFPSCEEKSRFVKKIFNLLSQARADKKTAIDWRETRQAFLDLSFATCPSNSCESSSETSAQVQVWEVERFLVTYGWRSPFLILDSETRWRWVNERLKRHPRIDSTKTRSECAQSKSPPIGFGELWKPLDEWQIFSDPAFTDRDGWMYAISFNSSTWRAAPGISASVRKRKWIRNFG